MSRVTPAAKRKLPYDISPETTDSKKRAVNTEKNKTTFLCNKLRRSGRVSNFGNNKVLLCYQNIHYININQFYHIAYSQKFTAENILKKIIKFDQL